MSESRTEDRLERLEADMREVKAALGRLEPLIIAIHTTSSYLALIHQRLERRIERRLEAGK